MILTISNLKGGTTKTTSAAYIAHAFHERGARVLVIDADPQASITRWAEIAEWAIPVRGMATGQLHLPSGVALEARAYDVIVIDTPPTERERGIVESAIRAATHVIVPLAPTTAEFERTAAVRQLIADAAQLAVTPPAVAALLTRTIHSAASTAHVRQMLRSAGWCVYEPTVARLERYAQAWGGSIERASASAYGDIVTALTGSPS